MPVIAFREWVPDSADFGNPGAPVVTNALPGSTSYKPFTSLVTATSALTLYPRGAIQASDENENEFLYAGDQNDLYELSAATWGTVSKGGGYSSGADERWEFVRWKEKVIASNFSDNPQSITFGGTAFADLTTALRFRHVAVVRDFIVAGYTFDGTDGTVRDRVRWSAQNDETDWTPSAATLSDFRDLGVGGGIQAIVGGDYGVIVSEESTFRMTFVGSPTIFQIDETLPGVGSVAPGGVVRLGDEVYFPSKQGFVQVRAGTTEQWIGAGRVDEFFSRDLDTDHLNRVSAVADVTSQKIFWAYPGAGNTNGRPNKIIVYDRALNRWGYAEVEVELLWQSGGTSTTLEQLDDLNLGADLVSNGGFDTDTIWTKGTGWTIAAGVATHAAGTASDLEQTVSILENTYYRVQFDVAGRMAGSVTPSVGDTTGTAVSANGTGNLESIRAGSGTQLKFEATSDFDGDIDNVSLKEIDDLDSMTQSLDSGEFKGSSALLAAFDSTFSSGNFTGTPYTATFRTKESELNEGRRTRLNEFTPLVVGGTVTGSVLYRNSQANPVTTTTPTATFGTSGKFKPRVNARYMSFEITVSGNWDDAVGIHIDRHGARPGERRG